MSEMSVQTAGNEVNQSRVGTDATLFRLCERSVALLVGFQDVLFSDEPPTGGVALFAR